MHISLEELASSVPGLIGYNCSLCLWWINSKLRYTEVKCAAMCVHGRRVRCLV
jgi:hypothetical protein